MSDPASEDLKAKFLPLLRAELAELRQSSVSTADDRRPVELDQQSVGRLSRMDAMQQQAMAAAQDARRHGRVTAIEAAIRRIETDEFGWCSDCGDSIGEKRIALDPTIMRCRDCAIG